MYAPRATAIYYCPELWLRRASPLAIREDDPFGSARRLNGRGTLSLPAGIHMPDSSVYIFPQACGHEVRRLWRPIGTSWLEPLHQPRRSHDEPRIQQHLSGIVLRHPQLAGHPAHACGSGSTSQSAKLPFWRRRAITSSTIPRTAAINLSLRNSHRSVGFPTDKPIPNQHTRAKNKQGLGRCYR